MLALACVYPGFFLSVGRGLFVALLLSVAVELIFGLLLRFEMGFMDYIFATIFSLYIGYDWARAQQYPKTADNAVDCAADLYIDITILFIRILSIVGDRD
jgi:FtsH-binding integral membrane protein